MNSRSRRASVERLSPASFGMVMATGIVSLAAHDLGMDGLAGALFALNVALYAILWILTGVRAALYRARFLGDMADHLRAPGFFTTVAASSLLGVQLLVLRDVPEAAWALWAVAVVLWLVLTYAIFAAFTIRADKPSLERGISGAWLLPVVATQSIAVLSALLAARTGAGSIALNFLALSMWLWGGMLYIWIMSLIFYRYHFFAFSPADLTPPYWINMGAMAISTLAGSLLVANAPGAPFLASLLPFVKGFTVFYWAAGTWWIPMLVVLAIWRYVVKRFPLRYDPLYWGAVFPLGMYAAGTHAMSRALGLDFLGFVAPAFLALALAAWAAAFAGLLLSLVRESRQP